MKRCALYMRVSTVDQHPETQLHDLRGLAAQRGYEVIGEYADKISGAKARRPGLDQLLADARRGEFDDAASAVNLSTSIARRCFVTALAG